MESLASYIDHTFLQPVADTKTIKRLCLEVKEYGFASVCVHPYFVSLVCEELFLTKVGITTVVGFPLGANLLSVKKQEARQALEEGATELDMVINLSAFKEGLYDYVKEEIYEIRMVAAQAVLKVIIETCYLTQEEKRIACEICLEVGADFIKTSTGFGPCGATELDVAFLRKIVGAKMGVKASGGIKTKAQALAMIHAGASRIGTSSSLAIIQS